MIAISKGELSATLDTPYRIDSFNQGTRFDRTGVFTSLNKGGRCWCGEWFEKKNPLGHDCVCGPSEEFIMPGYEDIPLGGTFVKIGVGRLVKTLSEPYDRFKLFEMADPGVMDIDASADEARFRHTLDGAYIYDKSIRLVSDSELVISHRLENTGSDPIKTHVYNHNFFTLGRMEIDEDRQLDLNFKPCGHWRDVYDSVALTESGIRFSRRLEKAEGSVFMGDVQSSSQNGCPLEGFKATMRDLRTGMGVEIMPDSPVEFSVFWSNHRIACIEPYTPLDIKPGGVYSWSVSYKLLEVNR